MTSSHFISLYSVNSEIFPFACHSVFFFSYALCWNQNVSMSTFLFCAMGSFDRLYWQKIAANSSTRTNTATIETRICMKNKRPIRSSINIDSYLTQTHHHRHWHHIIAYQFFFVFVVVATATAAITTSAATITAIIALLLLVVFAKEQRASHIFPSNGCSIQGHFSVVKE